MPCLTEALGLFVNLGNRTGKACVLEGLAAIYQKQQNNDKAIRALEECVFIYRANGDKHGQGTAMCNLGSCYRNLNNMKETILYFESAHRLFSKVDNRVGMKVCVLFALNHCSPVSTNRELWA
jgi:tetratricopeptide (TPR) repeat protein